MRIKNLKANLKTAILLASALLLGTGTSYAQVNLTAGPASATLPDGLDHAVSFAQVPTSGQTILVHPAGRLTAREKVVPLDFPFSLFGSAARERNFRLS